MRTLVVYVSVSHGNTKKIAQAIGAELAAEVVEPEEVAAAGVPAYDLVGLGSGIYGLTFHPRLWRFVLSLPQGKDTPVFLFATSGGPELWWRPAWWGLTRLLRSKGYRVVGTFSCRGYDTWLPLRLVGGLNPGRPAAADVVAAREFAITVRRSAGAAVSPPSPAATPAPKAPTTPRKASARRQPARS